MSVDSLMSKVFAKFADTGNLMKQSTSESLSTEEQAEFMLNKVLDELGLSIVSRSGNFLTLVEK